jgi:hypothetical protein
MNKTGTTGDPSIKIDELSALLCPACGDNHLHHILVIAFERDSEDAPTRVIVVQQDSSVRDVGELGKNPSSRRNGIAIRFWCENCDALAELTLAQHKGATLVGWRATPALAPDTYAPMHRYRPSLRLHQSNKA